MAITDWPPLSDVGQNDTLRYRLVPCFGHGTSLSNRLVNVFDHPKAGTIADGKRDAGLAVI